MHSRGVPSNGGFAFHHLELVKYYDDTGLLFPEISGELNIVNYSLTVISTFFPFFLMVSFGLDIPSMASAYGLLHGIFTAGFALVLYTILGRYGIIAFISGFVFIGVYVYSNNYLTVSTKDMATYFLIASVWMVFFRLFIDRPTKRDFVMLVILAAVLATSRNYTVVFCFSTVLVSFVYICCFYK